MTVSVQFFAAASTAAGTEEDQLSDGTLGEIIDQLGEKYGAAMTKVLGASSFLVDGVAAYERSTKIRSGQQLDVLPPFAGG